MDPLNKHTTILLLAALACTTQAVAQGYPSKPIRMLVPSASGGGTDATARVISQALTEQMGQSFVVDIRPGVAGRIGTEAGARAAPDGYTLVMGTVAPMAIFPGAGAKLTYDPVKDLAPISLLATTDYTLTVHPSLPARSVKELIAIARAKPGEITYASTGILSAPHLGGELINQLAKVELLHVPYKGNGPAVIGIMSGESIVMFATGPTVATHAKSGRLRALATTGPKRTNPDLPTMKETLPGFELTQWYGLLAPAGTSPEIIDRLHREIVRAVANPKVAKLFVDLGTLPVAGTPREFADFIKSEMDKWGKVVKTAGIPLD
jgi:tripartite-type tricarboxylate transporter receptor subunit TctC